MLNSHDSETSHIAKCGYSQNDFTSSKPVKFDKYKHNTSEWIAMGVLTSSSFEMGTTKLNLQN